LSYTIIYPKSRTTRELRRVVPCDPPTVGHSTVPDGEEEIFYSVSLNTAQLHAMARQAAKSKGQVSNDGPLRVSIISRKRITA